MAHDQKVAFRHEQLDLSTPRPCFRALNDLACLLGASKRYKKGISLEELMLRIESALADFHGYLVLFVDEVDNVRRDRDTFLSFLVRRLPQRIPAKLVLVFASNRLNWPDHLDPRIKSFLKLNELVFKPYDALDLQHILRIRVEKALHPGTVQAGVIEKIAALASQDHGDARQAVALLARSAYLAEKAGANITLGVVDEAATEIGTDRYLTLLRSAPSGRREAMAFRQVASSSSGLTVKLQKLTLERTSVPKKLPLVLAAAAELSANIEAISAVPTPPLIESYRDRLAANPSPQHRPAIVAGLWREAEIAMLISGTKMRKSWTVMHLAICIACGLEWLGHATKKGRVLLIDSELSRATTDVRLHHVARAMGIDPTSFANNLDIVNLRGRCGHMAAMIAAAKNGNWDPNGAEGLVDDNYTLADLDFDIFRRLQSRIYTAIIVDPVYKLMPDGMTEIDSAGWLRIFATIDRLCKQADVAVMLVHHTTKGAQDEKANTDIGSGSGVISRAPDLHLTITRRPGQDVHDDSKAIMRATTRTFAPAPEMYLIANQTSDTSLWACDTAGAEEAAKDAEPRSDASDALEAMMFASACARPDPESRELIIGRATYLKKKIPIRRARELFELAFGAGQIKLVGKNKRSPRYCRDRTREEEIQERLAAADAAAAATRNVPQTPP